MRKLFFMVAVVLALGGCKSRCRQLSEKLCDCAATSTDKTACLTRASTQEQNNPPNETDEQTCGALLDSCNCRLIDTPQGKVNCGLARPFGN
jgi:hypothetical protein